MLNPGSTNHGGLILTLQEALTLAQRHAHAPHFPRSLEWLLFTALECNADLMPSPSKQPVWRKGDGSGGQTAHPAVAGPLLLAAADLLRHFPQARTCSYMHAPALILF